VDGLWRGARQVVEGTFAEKNRKDFTVDGIRFTTRGATLYTIALDWPKGGKLSIKSLPYGCGAKVQARSDVG
jgi:alpha-L-fucosidase